MRGTQTARVIQDAATDGNPEMEEAAAAIVGGNGSVEIRPMEDALARFIQQEPAQYVKKPETNQEKKMQSLYNPDIYPDQIREMILQSGQTGIEIANRWMMGWPKRVVNLLVQDMYEDVFQYQLLQEQDMIARASSLSHLAPMEIVVMSGLSLEPPEV